LQTERRESKRWKNIYEELVQYLASATGESSDRILSETLSDANHI